jgi:negative regulator of flagellin synthesis FlgM
MRSGVMADIKLGATPPVGTVAMRISTTTRSGTSGASKTASADSAASTAGAGTQALDAGAAPVDENRVSLIRKAIADGNYPVLPARVGDAIIAAGILVWSSK